MKKQTFKDILGEGMAKPQSTIFFNAFVASGFILFLDDKLVRFNGKRKSNEFHSEKRPVAVTNKKTYAATFIPGTTKKHNGRYTVFVEPNQIKKMHKKGWYLIRYWQTEPAPFFEQGAKCIPGSRIPDKIFTEMQEKLRAFIDGQAG